HTRSDRDWSSDVCSSDLVLGEVVCADAFAALAGAHLAAPVGGDCGLLLFLGALEEAGLQDPQRLRTVLELRALVLAGHHEAGGKIGRASCRERVWMPVRA